MTYKLTGNNLFFAIDRTQILDISVGDIIAVDGYPGVNHIWTGHDSEFVENNPDDDIFLQIERVAGNKYKAVGILLKQIK
jgi:hypothetical protein